MNQNLQLQNLRKEDGTSADVLLQTAQRMAAYFIIAAIVKSQICCENKGNLESTSSSNPFVEH